MNLEKVVQALGLGVRCGGDKLKNEVTGGYSGDLLSDVIANCKEGDVWITRQVHQNIIAVASLRDVAGIILVQGNEPAPDTLEKAAEKGVPILVTDHSAFETAGRIYDLMNADIKALSDHRA
jgi:hypothetical protein